MDKRFGKIRRIDLTGQVYGKWTVREYDGKRGPNGRATYWLCVCECGAIRSVAAASLTRSRRPSRSCGCDRVDQVIASVRTHGCSNTATYSVWEGMIQRVSSPTRNNYHNYGGRGITVCERWKNFLNFLEDMGERPSRKHTLERVDNEGNYEPGNVIWEPSKSKQLLNSRRGLRITALAEALGLDRSKTRTTLFYARRSLVEGVRRGVSKERMMTVRQFLEARGELPETTLEAS